MPTTHYRLSRGALFYGYVFHFCNGRASRDLLSVTDEPEQVTCKRCRKQLEKLKVLVDSHSQDCTQTPKP